MTDLRQRLPIGDGIAGIIKLDLLKIIAAKSAAAAGIVSQGARTRRLAGRRSVVWELASCTLAQAGG